MDTVKAIQAEDEAELPVDTSNPVEVNNARKKYARTRATRLKFVEAAMTTFEGRSWFYDTLVRCKVFNTPYTIDPYQTAFNCGMANIGLQVLDDVQTVAAKNYILMMEENKSKNG